VSYCNCWLQNPTFEAHVCLLRDLDVDLVEVLSEIVYIIATNM